MGRITQLRYYAGMPIEKHIYSTSTADERWRQIAERGTQAIPDHAPAVRVLTTGPIGSDTSQLHTAPFKVLLTSCVDFWTRLIV